MNNKLLAILLCTVMLLSFLPVSLAAADEMTVKTYEELVSAFEDYDYPNGPSVSVADDIKVTGRLYTAGGTITVESGKTLSVAKDGYIECKIKNNGKIIVEAGGFLGSTISGEIVNNGEIVIDKGGEMRSLKGGAIKNEPGADITINGSFYCGCHQIPDAPLQLWFINNGTVDGTGTVGLFQSDSGEPVADLPAAKAKLVSMLGPSWKEENVSIVISKVDVKITEPKIGNTADTAAVVETVPANAAVIMEDSEHAPTWRDDSFSKLKGSFEKGKVYKYYIYIKANDGYRFEFQNNGEYDGIFSVNGKGATYTSDVYDTDNAVYAYTVFSDPAMIIDGTEYSLTDLKNDISGSGWNWSSVKQELTLNGYNGSYIKAASALTINVAENTDNTIVVPEDVDECGIYSYGSLAVLGKGNLNIDVQNFDEDGIYSNGGRLCLIDMDGNLNIKSNEYGIVSYLNMELSGNGNITIESVDNALFIDSVLTVNGSGNLKIISDGNCIECYDDVIFSGSGNVSVISNGAGKSAIVLNNRENRVRMECIGNSMFFKCADGGKVINNNNAPDSVIVVGDKLEKYKITGSPEGASVLYERSDHIHVYTDEVVSPTCLEGGYTVHTCICGKTFSDAYTDALGHDFDGWKIQKEPEPGTEGYKTRECLRCGYSEIKYLPPTEMVSIERIDLFKLRLSGWYEDCDTIFFAKGSYSSLDDIKASDFQIINLVGKSSVEIMLDEIGTYTFAVSNPVADMVELYVSRVRSPFEDVPENVWYTVPCLWCASNGYITGTSDTIFNPNGKLTRAMFVLILGKLDGVDFSKITYKGKFDDVKDGVWYAKAVQWAVECGVTGGTGAKTFSPQNPVTREQLASFFFAYAKYKKYDTGARCSLEKYTDRSSVSKWALDAITWAISEGLISGTTDTTLSPKNSATRAQSAVIFKNFAENYVVKQK